VAGNNINFTVRAIGNFTQLETEIAKLQKTIRTVQSTPLIGSTAAQDVANIKKVQDRFDQMVGSSRAFNIQMVQSADHIKTLGQNLERGKLKLHDYYSLWSQRNSKASTELNQLVDQQARLGKSFILPDALKTGWSRAITNLTADLKTLGAQEDAVMIKAKVMNSVVRGLGTEMVNFGKNTQWAGRQLTVGLTVPLAAFAAMAAKQFRDVNTELTRMQRLYGLGLKPPSDAELNAISKKIMDLSTTVAKTMGIAQTETVKAAASFAAIGLQGSQLVEATNQAMRLSKLGAVDAQTAQQTVVSLQNVYKVNSGNLAEAVNFLNDIQKQTSTSLRDLTDAMPRVGPIVAQLGGTYKDTALMMIAMKEAGVPAAQSANAIKSAMASLIAPTSSAQKEFQKFGISLTSIKTETKGNPIAMVTDLQMALQKLDPTTQAVLIEKLFGKFQFARIEALINNLGRAGSQTQNAFKVANASARELATLADQEMRVATNSVSAKYERALQGFKASILPIGEAATKIATKFLEVFNGISNFINKLGPLKGVLTGILGGAAVIGPILMLTGLFGNLIGSIIKGMNVFAMFKKGFSSGGWMGGLKGLTNYFEQVELSALKAAENTQTLTGKTANAQEAFKLLNKEVQLLESRLRDIAMNSGKALSPTSYANMTDEQLRQLNLYEAARKQQGGERPHYESKATAFKNYQANPSAAPELQAMEAWYIAQHGSQIGSRKFRQYFEEGQMAQYTMVPQGSAAGLLQRQYGQEPVIYGGKSGQTQSQVFARETQRLIDIHDQLISGKIKDEDLAREELTRILGASSTKGKTISAAQITALEGIVNQVTFSEQTVTNNVVENLTKQKALLVGSETAIQDLNMELTRVMSTGDASDRAARVAGAWKIFSDTLSTTALAEIRQFQTAITQQMAAAGSPAEALLAARNAEAEIANTALVSSQLRSSVLGPGETMGAQRIKSSIVGYGSEITRATGLQTGGHAWVPGSGTGDKVPAMLEPGEFVVNRNAAKQYGGMLEDINFNRAPRFMLGGYTDRRGKKLTSRDMESVPTDIKLNMLKYAPKRMVEQFGINPRDKKSDATWELKGSNGIYIGDIRDRTRTSINKSLDNDGVSPREFIKAALNGSRGQNPGEQIHIRGTHSDFLQELYLKGSISKSNYETMLKEFDRRYITELLAMESSGIMLTDKNNPLARIQTDVINSLGQDATSAFKMFTEESVNITAKNRKAGKKAGGGGSTSARIADILFGSTMMQIPALKGSRSTGTLFAHGLNTSWINNILALQSGGGVPGFDEGGFTDALARIQAVADQYGLTGKFYSGEFANALMPLSEFESLSKAEQKQYLDYISNLSHGNGKISLPSLGIGTEHQRLFNGIRPTRPVGISSSYVRGVPRVTGINPYTGEIEYLPEGINPFTGLPEGQFGPRPWKDFTVGLPSIKGRKDLLAPFLFSSERKAQMWATADEQNPSNVAPAESWRRAGIGSRVSDPIQEALQSWVGGSMGAFRSPIKDNFITRVKNLLGLMGPLSGQDLVRSTWARYGQKNINGVRTPIASQFGPGQEKTLVDMIQSGNLLGLSGMPLDISGLTSWADASTLKDKWNGPSLFSRLKGFLKSAGWGSDKDIARKLKGEYLGNEVPLLLRLLTAGKTQGVGISGLVKDPTYMGQPLDLEMMLTREHILKNPRVAIDSVSSDLKTRLLQLNLIERQKGGGIPGFATGGSPWVPGSGNGDRVPAMLEPGEYVVNKNAAKQYGSLLNHLNWNAAPRFIEGSGNRASRRAAEGKGSVDPQVTLIEMQDTIRKFSKMFPSSVIGEITAGLHDGLVPMFAGLQIPAAHLANIFTIAKDEVKKSADDLADGAKKAVNALKTGYQNPDYLKQTPEHFTKLEKASYSLSAIFKKAEDATVKMKDDLIKTGKQAKSAFLTGHQNPDLAGRTPDYFSKTEKFATNVGALTRKDGWITMFSNIKDKIGGKVDPETGSRTGMLSKLGKIGSSNPMFGMIAQMAAPMIGGALQKVAGNNQIAQGAIGMGQAGAQIGSMFGPGGALIGAGLGAVGGLIKGWADEQVRKSQDTAAGISSSTRLSGTALDALGIKLKGFGGATILAANKLETASQKMQKNIDAVASALKNATDTETVNAIKNLTDAFKDKDIAKVSNLMQNLYRTTLAETGSKDKAKIAVQGYLKASGASETDTGAVLATLPTQEKANTLLSNIIKKGKGTAADIGQLLSQVSQGSEGLSKFSSQLNNLSSKGISVESYDTFKSFNDTVTATNPQLAKTNNLLWSTGVSMKNIVSIDSLMNSGLKGTSKQMLILGQNTSVVNGLMDVYAKKEELASSVSNLVEKAKKDYADKQEKRKKALEKDITTQQSLIKSDEKIIKSYNKKIKIEDNLIYNYNQKIKGYQKESSEIDKSVNKIQKEIDARQKLYDKNQQAIQQEQTLSDLRSEITRAAGSGDILAQAAAQDKYNKELERQASLRAKEALDAAAQGKIDNLRLSQDQLNLKIENTQNLIDGCEKKQRVYNTAIDDTQNKMDNANGKITTAQQEIDTMNTKAEAFNTTLDGAGDKIAAWYSDPKNKKKGIKDLVDFIKNPNNGLAGAISQTKSGIAGWATQMDTTYNSDSFRGFRTMLENVGKVSFGNNLFKEQFYMGYFQQNPGNSISDANKAYRSAAQAAGFNVKRKKPKNGQEVVQNGVNYIYSNGKWYTWTWSNTPGDDNRKIYTETTKTPKDPDGVPYLRAMGGYVRGAGDSTSDSIPARLSNGEYVVKASAVAQYGSSFLDGINQQRYAKGGMVMPNRALPHNDKFREIVGWTTAFDSKSNLIQKEPIIDNLVHLGNVYDRNQLIDFEKSIISRTTNLVHSLLKSNKNTLEHNINLPISSILSNYFRKPKLDNSSIIPPAIETIKNIMHGYTPTDKSVESNMMSGAHLPVFANGKLYSNPYYYRYIRNFWTKEKNPFGQGLDSKNNEVTFNPLTVIPHEMGHWMNDAMTKMYKKSGKKNIFSSKFRTQVGYDADRKHAISYNGKFGYSVAEESMADMWSGLFNRYMYGSDVNSIFNPPSNSKYATNTSLNPFDPFNRGGAKTRSDDVLIGDRHGKSHKLYTLSNADVHARYDQRQLAGSSGFNDPNSLLSIFGLNGFKRFSKINKTPGARDLWNNYIRDYTLTNKDFPGMVRFKDGGSVGKNKNDPDKPVFDFIGLLNKKIINPLMIANGKKAGSGPHYSTNHHMTTPMQIMRIADPIRKYLVGETRGGDAFSGPGGQIYLGGPDYQDPGTILHETGHALNTKLGRSSNNFLKDRSTYNLGVGTFLNKKKNGPGWKSALKDYGNKTTNNGNTIFAGFRRIPVEETRAQVWQGALAKLMGIKPNFNTNGIDAWTKGGNPFSRKPVPGFLWYPFDKNVMSVDQHPDHDQGSAASTMGYSRPLDWLRFLGINIPKSLANTKQDSIPFDAKIWTKDDSLGSDFNVSFKYKDIKDAQYDIERSNSIEPEASAMPAILISGLRGIWAQIINADQNMQFNTKSGYIPTGWMQVGGPDIVAPGNKPIKPIKTFNNGGYIRGLGTGTSDSIPARLSNGEYVVKASSVAKYGTSFLNNVNEQKFKEGGLVGNKHKHHGSGRGGGSQVNYNPYTDPNFHGVGGNIGNTEDNISRSPYGSWWSAIVDSSVRQRRGFFGSGLLHDLVNPYVEIGRGFGYGAEQGIQMLMSGNMFNPNYKFGKNTHFKDNPFAGPNGLRNLFGDIMLGGGIGKLMGAAKNVTRPMWEPALHAAKPYVVGGIKWAGKGLMNVGRSLAQGAMKLTGTMTRGVGHGITSVMNGLNPIFRPQIGNVTRGNLKSETKQVGNEFQQQIQKQMLKRVSMGLKKKARPHNPIRTGRATAEYMALQDAEDLRNLPISNLEMKDLEEAARTGEYSNSEHILSLLTEQRRIKVVKAILKDKGILHGMGERDKIYGNILEEIRYKLSKEGIESGYQPSWIHRPSHKAGHFITEEYPYVRQEQIIAQILGQKKLASLIGKTKSHKDASNLFIKHYGINGSQIMGELFSPHLLGNSERFLALASSNPGLVKLGAGHIMGPTEGRATQIFADKFPSIKKLNEDISLKTLKTIYPGVKWTKDTLIQVMRTDAVPFLDDPTKMMGLTKAQRAEIMNIRKIEIENAGFLGATWDNIGEGFMDGYGRMNRNQFGYYSYNPENLPLSLFEANVKDVLDPSRITSTIGYLAAGDTMGSLGLSPLQAVFTSPSVLKAVEKIVGLPKGFGLGREEQMLLRDRAISAGKTEATAGSPWNMRYLSTMNEMGYTPNQMLKYMLKFKLKNSSLYDQQFDRLKLDEKVTMIQQLFKMTASKDGFKIGARSDVLNFPDPSALAFMKSLVQRLAVFNKKNPQVSLEGGTTFYGVHTDFYALSKQEKQLFETFSRQKLNVLQMESIERAAFVDMLEQRIPGMPLTYFDRKMNNDYELWKDGKLAHVKPDMLRLFTQILKMEKNRNKGFASGGYISGAGTATSDSIPARLSNGEYVVRADSVARYGTSFLDGINEQKFATGGLVNSKRFNIPSIGANYRIGGDANNANSSFNDNSVYNINVSVDTNASPDDIASAVMKKIERQQATISTGRKTGGMR